MIAFFLNSYLLTKFVDPSFYLTLVRQMTFLGECSLKCFILSTIFELSSNASCTCKTYLKLLFLGEDPVSSKVFTTVNVLSTFEYRQITLAWNTLEQIWLSCATLSIRHGQIWSRVTSWSRVEVTTWPLVSMAFTLDGHMVFGHIWSHLEFNSVDT